MKSLFPGYYRPSEAEFKKLWDEGVFSFDTNVLLNLYRIDRTHAAKFLKALKRLEQRVWLPYQVAFEFASRRVEVIQEQFAVYQRMKEYLKKSGEQFKKEFSRHPFIPLNAIHRLSDDFLDKVAAELERAEKAHPDATYEDPVSQELDSIFCNRVGPKPTDKEHEASIKECERRYEKGIPPGDKDKSKGGDRQYGDAILWLELVKYAAAHKTPIILVTEDVKTDWWQELRGKTIGPRPELLQEMAEKADVACYLYRTAQFLDRALPDDQDKAKVIEAVKEVEKDRRALASSEEERTHRRVGELMRCRHELAHLNMQVEELWADVAKVSSQIKDLTELSNDPICSESERAEIAGELVSLRKQHMETSRQAVIMEERRSALRTYIDGAQGKEQYVKWEDIVLK